MSKEGAIKAAELTLKAASTFVKVVVAIELVSKF